MINTEDGLNQYIRRRLGEPLINIDITDYKISDRIDETIQKYSEFALSGTELNVLRLNITPGIYQYQLDDRVLAIYNMRTSSTGFGNGLGFSLPGNLVVTNSELIYFGLGGSGTGFDTTNFQAVLSNMATLSHYYTLEPNFQYNAVTKTLTFFEDVSIYPHVIFEAQLRYDPKPIDNVFDQVWIKRYAIALCKLQWGENIGKFDANILNGAKVNYDRIIKEAQEEIEKLDEELKKTWSRSFGIVRF